jgi:peptide deformylase
MIRRILTLPQDKRVLRTPSAEVTKADDWQAVAQDLTDTLRATPTAIGLAAPQIGVLLRVFVVRGNEGKILTLVNPVILQTGSEYAESDEGCLSLPGCHARVSRATSLRLVAVQMPGMSTPLVRAAGIFARVIQHELDHLDGKLITDREAERA